MGYLGRNFSASGMTSDNQKLAAVQDWATPTNVSQLKSFLGLASYYRRYISDFAHIAAPLHCLTQKNAPFLWNANCQQAFSLLKEMLTHAPILAYPRFTSSTPLFSLQIDAITVGIGAVLEQRDMSLLMLVDLSCRQRGTAVLFSVSAW